MECGDMNDSSIMTLLKKINWDIPENRDIASQLALDAKEYFIRVADHIYTGNEIRADSFMDAMNIYTKFADNNTIVLLENDLPDNYLN